MSTKKFSSIDKNHSFSINIIEDTAYFIIEEINPEHYKTLLLLLKSGFEYMVNSNVKYVKQYINKEDSGEFKRSIVIEEDNMTVVKTKIEDFLFELCDALGFQRL